MSKIEYDIKKSAWRLEFEDWLAELKKRRTETHWDTTNQKDIDWFFDISDRCWGDINGRLSVQYFDLLTEIQRENPKLYDKYIDQSTRVLNLFSF